MSNGYPFQELGFQKYKINQKKCINVRRLIRKSIEIQEKVASVNMRVYMVAPKEFSCVNDGHSLEKINH